LSAVAASRFIVSLAAALLAGCAGSGPWVERLDERTGTTVARGGEPLVFAHAETRHSRSARDYLYLGPVEINRQGVREYLLWVGVATTLDRGYLAPALAPPEVLYVTARGEPMELKLAPWEELAGPGAAAPYAPAVPLERALGARVTLQQLTWLAEEPPRSLVARGAGRGGLEYARWDKHGTWKEFVGRAEAGLKANRLQ
jgi:hypothetical protein